MSDEYIKDNSDNLNWIYYVRALAVFAVVVCHQQGILHYSEFVQLLTLFSVPVLVVMMGITSSIWYGKRVNSLNAETDIFASLAKKMMPVLFTYIFATFVYLVFDSGQLAGINDYKVFLDALLSFNASGPFYFIEYYIALTLVSPFLYLLVKRINGSKSPIIWQVLLVIACLCLGYVLFPYVHCLGGSFLSLYASGMIWGGATTESFESRGYLLA